VGLRYAKWTAGAKDPVRKHATDAGVDVFADETVTIAPFKAAKVATGITFEIREDFMLLAKPKSGSDFLLGAGVIDTGYQNQIFIKVINYTDQLLFIEKGQALAQLVQVPVLKEPLEEVASPQILHAVKSSRGTDGGIVRQS
jgi:dUTP pyrophosphatase